MLDGEGAIEGVVADTDTVIDKVEEAAFGAANTVMIIKAWELRAAGTP